MTLQLIFGIGLLAAVLVSARAERGLLSTAVLFLALGVASALANLVPAPDPSRTRYVAELALVATLFIDGGKLDLRALRDSFALSGRALLIGLPVNLALCAVLAHTILGMSWSHALLVAAVLSPTDPVFASSVVGSDGVPTALRRLLNVESGVNDGLAVAIVVTLLEHSGESGPTLPVLVGRAALGVIIGAVVPPLAVWLYRRPAFGASDTYKPLLALAVVTIVWSAARALHANEFLGAFTAGVTLSSLSARARDHWANPGELFSEVLKLGALLLFGAQIAHENLRDAGLPAIAFALAALFVARPTSIAVAMFGSAMPWRERLVASWFGPRGFASVVFGLLVLVSHIPEGRTLFHVIAIVVAVSMVLHATSDTLVSKWIANASRTPAQSSS